LELIVGGVFLLIVFIIGGIYMSDRQGWNATFKRLSRISRASLESRSTTSIGRVPTGEKERWMAEFTGKTAELTTLPEPKHAIVKHNYYETHMGPWPQWVCKCGTKQYEVVIGRLARHERAAARHGKQHVRKMNKQDKTIDNSVDFQF
jgi:hypothetical protein